MASAVAQSTDPSCMDCTHTDLWSQFNQSCAINPSLGISTEASPILTSLSLSIPVAPSSFPSCENTISLHLWVKDLDPKYLGFQVSLIKGLNWAVALNSSSVFSVNFPLIFSSKVSLMTFSDQSWLANPFATEWWDLIFLYIRGWVKLGSSTSLCPYFLNPIISNNISF